MRADEVIWIPDYEYDLESDMSRFHRIDDMYSMEAARFFRLAFRVVRYEDSITRQAILRDQEELEGPAPQAPSNTETISGAEFMANNPELFQFG